VFSFPESGNQEVFPNPGGSISDLFVHYDDQKENMHKLVIHLFPNLLPVSLF
jgi:hypothetical protein